MSKLSKFSNDEAKLIVSVPYRVGMWISTCDDNTKSKFDDKRERQALEATIKRMAGLHRKMPFAAEIMRQIEQNKSSLQIWNTHVTEEKVLEEVTQAVTICKEKLGPAETKQYKQALWQTGLVVAQAFGEQIDPDNEMHVDRFFAWIGSFFSTPKLAKSPENMSAKEKTALKKLRAVLKQ